MDEKKIVVKIKTQSRGGNQIKSKLGNIQNINKVEFEIKDNNARNFSKNILAIW